MEQYISLNALRRGDFDKALEKLGYIRATDEAKRLGITRDKLNKMVGQGCYKDTFVVNNVRYILPYPEDESHV